jgi:hypothetical protein
MHSMAGKRPVDPAVAGAGPPAKKLSLATPPLDIGPAAGEEDLDMKVLQVIFGLWSGWFTWPTLARVF